MISQIRHYNIRIPPGIETGIMLKAEGQGHVPAKDAIPGDLLIGVEVEPDPRFERDGNDVFSEVKVDFAIAIKGGEVTGETIDGPMRIKIDPGTPPEYRIRMKGKGFPTLESRGKNRGNHIFTVKITLPRYNDLTREQKEHIDGYLNSIKK